MAKTTFSGPIKADTIGVILPTYTVATAPAIASVETGNVIFVSDAATNACLAVSDGTNWLRADTGAVLS